MKRVRTLAALVAVLTAVAVLVGLRWIEARRGEADREAAQAAARQYAHSLTSLGYRTIDADIARLLRTTTGRARQDVAANAKAMKDGVVGSRTTYVGTLRAVGLVSMSDRGAEALVAGDSIARTAADKAPRPTFWRWKMGLTKVGDRWLVSSSEQVG